MLRRALMLATAGACFWVIWSEWQAGQADTGQAQADTGQGDQAPDLMTQTAAAITNVGDSILTIVGGWGAPAEYAGMIRAAEQENGIPPRMLERLLWTECRWRKDVIEGRKISSAGAVGIAQIVPKWHPGVDPLNVPQAIAYAGRFLMLLARRYEGDWKMALAAYNWGPGNLEKYGLAKAPLETRNYYGSILSALGMA